MYGSLPAHDGAAQPGSSVAEQPTIVSTTPVESAVAGNGTSNTSVPALVVTAPASVPPTTSDTGYPTPPPRDTACRHAEKALALLTATCASLSAKHADTENPFYDHAASICKLAHGQLLRLDAASLLESTAALAFISNPDAPAGLSKQRLRPGMSPKKKTRGKARVTTPLAAESSPEKLEAAKFFVPSKYESSLLEEVGKQQTACKQQKAEHAEARARAKLQAKKQPKFGAAGSKASAIIDSSGNATGKENKSHAANLPEQPHPAPSSQQPLPSHDLPGVQRAAAIKHASINSSGAREAACKSPAQAAAHGNQPLPAPVMHLDTGLVAKRRRVQPSWLTECVKEF
ncbi:g5368 [Coccomyxa elongata]